MDKRELQCKFHQESQTLGCKMQFNAISKVPHQLASLNPGPEAETEELVLGGHARNRCA